MSEHPREPRRARATTLPILNPRTGDKLVLAVAAMALVWTAVLLTTGF